MMIRSRACESAVVAIRRFTSAATDSKPERWETGFRVFAGVQASLVVSASGGLVKIDDTV
jgi:hypothetical protein